YADVPSISCDDPRLVSLIGMMLRKPPESRPELERVQQILTRIVKTPHQARIAASIGLAKAGMLVEERESRQLAEVERLKKEKAAREALLNSAVSCLRQNLETLWEEINNSAPSARRNDDSQFHMSFQLGD